MKFSLEMIRRLRAGASFRPGLPLWLLMVLAVFSAGQASAQFTATVTGTALTCNTTTGPSAAVTVTIRASPAIPATGGTPITVALHTVPTGLVVTSPSSLILNSTNNTAGIVFTVRAADGCAGLSSGANTLSVPFRVQGGSTNVATAATPVTVTATASSLTPTPTSIALTCVLSGSTYTPGPAQTLSIASSIPAASFGSVFTIDSTSNGAASAAVTVTGFSGSHTANSTTPKTFSVVASSGCGGGAVNTTVNTTITLLNAPAPNRVIPVTLRILAPTPLTATPSSASLTYVKGSGTAGRADVTIAAGSGTPFFSVDTTTLPIWLTVDAFNGTVPRSIRFLSTSVADTLAAGTYSATVRFRVANFGDLSVPVTLAVNNAAPRLSISEGTTRNINWTLGAAVPTMFVTAVSSDSPIPYTLASSGKLAPIVASSLQSGLAYSFGTQIPVTFDPLLFASAEPGQTLTGVLTFTWGNPSAQIVVTINVNVVSANATVSGISPGTLPTAASGTTFTTVLTGAGFIPGTDPALRTRVGIVSSGVIVTNTNISSTVINGSNIQLTIVVPAVADAALPFSPTGTGGSVVIGICNPVNGVCNTPTGTATLTIGNNPIVQAVTSASAFRQVNPGTAPSISPYDMLSVFGTSFCTSGGTGCSSSQVVYGSADAATLTYPTSLSPEAAGASQRFTSVIFQTQGGSPTLIATAPLLFVTNNQINIMVPAALSARIGQTVDMVVRFGFGSGATLRSSAPFPVSVVATNPGLFTVGSNGQGDGAVLDSNWAVVGVSNPAGVRTDAASSSSNFSDSVRLYLTGLGSPITGADNASTGSSAWHTDCISTTSYLTSLNAAASSSLTAVDGTIIQSSLLNTGRLAPCISAAASNAPTVTVGGRAATVTYAGWVPDGIAGLYQVDVRLPVNGGTAFTNSAGASVAQLLGPTQLPVVVTSASNTTQAGVNVWVTPRLRVVAPTILTGTVGVAWSTAGGGNVVTASEGTSTYRYALTSGLLPAGLTLNTATGAITGTPAANTSGTYAVTVTVTDSAPVPVTGTVRFTLTIAGGLFVTTSGSSPFTGTFGTANASVTTVAASGGLAPYSYAITTPSTLPTGLTIGASSGVLGFTSSTPAGGYNLTVTATDAVSGTPVTGSTSFALNIAMLLTDSNPLTPATGTGGPVRTITATGGTGAITYATPTAGFSINSSGVLSAASSVAAGTYTVVVNATAASAPTGGATAATGTITLTDVVVIP